MRIAVIGAGGVGGYFGGSLARAGHTVTFVARGEHGAALGEDGLTVLGTDGNFHVYPVRAVTETTQVGAVDAVLLCVKTWQLPEALPLLPPLMDADTRVVTLQNGVEAPQQVAEVIGRDAILPGVARIFSWVDRPGVVRYHGGPASLTFGPWRPGPSPRAEELRDALRDAEVEVAVQPDIWPSLWEKFLFVVPFGALGAATDVPMGMLRSRPGTRRILTEAMTEIRALASALGVQLPSDAVDAALKFADRQPADARSSLHRDIRAGRHSELDAWSGAVIRIAAHVGLPVPTHRLLHDVLDSLGQPATTE